MVLVVELEHFYLVVQTASLDPVPSYSRVYFTIQSLVAHLFRRLKPMAVPFRYIVYIGALGVHTEAAKTLTSRLWRLKHRRRSTLP